jgi:hypothetical protein
MPIIFTAVFSFFGTVAGKFLTDSALKYVAYKTLMVTLITVTLPAVIKSLITWLFEGLISIASSVDGIDQIDSVNHTFTGFVGYLAGQMMLPECIAVVLTACAVRLALNFIPFIG